MAYSPLQFLQQVRQPLAPVVDMSPYFNALGAGMKFQSGLNQQALEAEQQLATQQAAEQAGGDLRLYGQAMLGVNPSVGLQALQIAQKENESQIDPAIAQATEELKRAILSGDKQAITAAYSSLQGLRGGGLVNPAELLFRQEVQAAKEEQFDEEMEKKRIDQEQKNRALQLQQNGLDERIAQRAAKEEADSKRLSLQTRALDARIKKATQDAKAKAESEAAKQSKAPKYTGDQTLAAGYGLRMVEGDKIISSLEDGWMRLEKNVPGVLRTEDSQKREQAARSFINAVLRRESGASIQDPEFISAELQYFPQAGDSEAVIKQKKQTRLQAIAMMKVGAGDAWSDVQKEYQKLLGTETPNSYGTDDQGNRLGRVSE